MKQETKNKLETIATLLAEGISNGEIAEQLNISISRVSQYKKQIEQLKLYDNEEDEIVILPIILTRRQLNKLKEVGDPRNIINRFLIDVEEGEIHIDYGTSLPTKRITNLDDLDIETVHPKGPLQLTPELEAMINDDQDEGETQAISATNPADGKAPSSCTACGSTQITVFEDERVWQCDACLAEESY